MKSQTEMREETSKAKLKYGVLGLVFGAVGAMIIGFVWGGWTTSGTTQRMTEEAVLASQAAICVAQFMKEPNHVEKLKEFEKVNGSGRELNSLKRVAGIKCPGKKRRIFGYAEHAPMGLNFLSKNEFGCKGCP